MTLFCQKLLRGALDLKDRIKFHWLNLKLLSILSRKSKGKLPNSNMQCKTHHFGSVASKYWQKGDTVSFWTTLENWLARVQWIRRLVSCNQTSSWWKTSYIPSLQWSFSSSLSKWKWRHVSLKISWGPMSFQNNSWTIIYGTQALLRKQKKLLCWFTSPTHLMILSIIDHSQL